MMKMGSLRTVFLTTVMVWFGGASGYSSLLAAEVTPLSAVTKSVLVIDAQVKSQWGRKSRLGAGVIIRRDGYGVTAAHVVADADRLFGRWEGKEHSLELVAVDSERDLALFRLVGGAAQDFTPLNPSNDVVEVTQAVYAVGHPHGFLYSISRGIISGLGRSVELKDRRHGGLIQTDAGICPGNSGGPLLRIPDGAWIGLVVAVHDTAGHLGFAVPAPVVREFLSQHLPHVPSPVGPTRSAGSQ